MVWQHIREVRLGLVKEWVPREQDLEIYFVELHCDCGQIGICYQDLVSFDHRSQCFFLFGLVLLFLLLRLFYLLLLVLVVISIILCQLVHDFVEEVAPVNNWVVEVLLANFARLNKVGKTDVEVEIGGEIVILQLALSLLWRLVDCLVNLNGLINSLLQ